MRREGSKMIVVMWSHFHLHPSKSQCYKLNPALRVLVSGTTYCSLTCLLACSFVTSGSQVTTGFQSIVALSSRETRLTVATIPCPKPLVTSEKQGSGHLWTTRKRWIRRIEGRGCLTSKQNQARTDICIRVHLYPIAEDTG